MKKVVFIFFILVFLFNSLSTYAFVSKAVSKKVSKDNVEEPKEEKKPVEKPIEKDFTFIHVGALLQDPSSFINKKIKLRGEFSSFSTLALDYKPALRKSKEYISFAIFRPKTKIPLSELKLAYPIDKAKQEPELIDLNKGDIVDIYGLVFSSALDEPWVDVSYIKKIKSAPNSKDKKEDNELE